MNEEIELKINAVHSTRSPQSLLVLLECNRGGEAETRTPSLGPGKFARSGKKMHRPPCQGWATASEEAVAAKFPSFDILSFFDILQGRKPGQTIGSQPVLQTFGASFWVGR